MMRKPYRREGYLTLTLTSPARGEHKIQRWIDVSYRDTQELKAKVLMAARNRWPGQQVTIDLSTLNEKSGAQIFVATSREPVARFTVNHTNFVDTSPFPDGPWAA